MDSKLTLAEVVAKILQQQKSSGRSEDYLTWSRQIFSRLLRLADQRGETAFSEELAKAFLEDDRNIQTGKFSHGRLLMHTRCIRILRLYLETGETEIRSYPPVEKPPIPAGLAAALDTYDRVTAASGLTAGTLAKNRQPVRYLLEFMASLGYQNLSDIRHGDTVKAISAMLEKHYAPTSLGSYIGGLRRFYEMFPELHQFFMEIPCKLPRKRTIIEVYTNEEQERLYTYLSSPDISKRDAAICLLSLETGLRNVDICSLRTGDVDWKHNAIHIIQSKTNQPLNLPLRASYGNAMAAYLLEERPPCNQDYFFLSLHPPYGKLNQTWHIIQTAVASAGVSTSGRLTGSRMFRHNAASSMLRNGVPLPVIAEELGHRSQDSTMVYISTDREILSSLTLPLPKGGCHK